MDVQNISETVWTALSNVDPERDIFFTKGPLDVLDHSSPQPIFGSKAGIDATVKFPAEGHQREWPEIIEMDMKTKSLVEKRWKEYGLD